MHRIMKRFKRMVSRFKPFSFRNSDNIILIYTMGKVGSSTVYDLLRENYPRLNVFHAHFLSEKALKHTLPSLNPEYHINIGKGERILEYIQAHQQRPLKIITLVRDPLMRDISDIFQNWKAKLGNVDYSAVDSAQLCEYLNNIDHHYTLNWFEDEFKEYLGFDIYSVPFDQQKGYMVYHVGKTEILCLKLERLDEVFNSAITDFLGTHSMRMKKSNQSSGKKTADLYKELKSVYKADAGKIDTVYNSKFVTHFYSENEIESFKMRWS